MPDRDADILVIMSGGTIDAEGYEETPDRVTPLERSLIPDMVERLGHADRCEFFQWLMKDSQDFSAEEIGQLADIIRADERQHFIVTHGTDAMVQNAKRLEGFLEGSGKTVFFVGAMEPLVHGKGSDGPENLDHAFKHIRETAQGQGGGVFIVGRSEIAKGTYGPRIYRPGEAVKDREHKVFRPIPEQQERQR